MRVVPGVCGVHGEGVRLCSLGFAADGRGRSGGVQSKHWHALVKGHPWAARSIVAASCSVPLCTRVVA